MSYPDTYYRQRQATGEQLAGKNLQDDNKSETDYTPISDRIVYGVTGVVVALISVRIITRLSSVHDTRFGQLINDLTSPYVWVFNSLFGNTPALLVTTMEPGSLIALFFYPLLGWAILGLISEIKSGNRFHRTHSKVRR